MGIFKDIDKTQPNWREERSDFWNSLCDLGRKVGLYGKTVGRTVGPIIGKTVGMLIDAVIPIVEGLAIQMVLDLKEDGIAFVQGAIKKASDQDIKGIEKFDAVFNEAKEWLSDKGIGLDENTLKTYIQTIFLGLRNRGEA